MRVKNILPIREETFNRAPAQEKRKPDLLKKSKGISVIMTGYVEQKATR